MTVRRTAEDVAAWERLVAQVLGSIGNPGRQTIDLERAAHKAAKAVFPAEPYTQANPWNALLAASRRFASLTTMERLDAAGELEAALAAAQAHHAVGSGGATIGRAATEPEPPPRLPYRADIDG